MEEKGVKKLAEKLQKTEKALESVQSKYQKGQEKIKELDKKLQSTSDKLSRSKNKNELLKQELEKEKKKNKSQSISQQSIRRHKYTDFVVTLCVEIVLRCHCGFRSASNLVGYLNELLGWKLETIPCANSIENWVKKSGYAIYTTPQVTPEESRKAYAEIIDESIMLGSEKMVLTLGVDAEKTGEKALNRLDVNVLNISVASNWNSESIREVLEETEKKKGKAPLYVVSDNDSKLNKSIKEKGYIHIRDVGHTMALLIEQIYKDSTDFKAYIKCLSAVKVREVMRATSYLLPPCQRTIARFMNLSSIIKWSQRIRKAFPKLTQQEQETFAFTNTYRKFIEELDCVFEFVNESLKLIKTKGLSKKNIDLCLKMANELLNDKAERVVLVRNSITQYLLEEQDKLPNDKKTVWHASSDIIESIFGTYKFKMSKNRLNGITPFVLILPLLTKAGEGKELSNIDFKANLESVFMKNLYRWREDNLTENLAVKRKTKLAG